MFFSTKLSAFWDQDFKCNYDILCVVSNHYIWQELSLRTWDICESRQWDYFGSTLQQIALCMIQFARAVLSENSVCMLEFGILVKMLHIFGHNTDSVFSGVLFCCMPSSNCFVWLAEGQVFSILNNAVKWNRTPRCSHKICSCTQIVVNI